jgi:hypothetical protein
MVAVMKRGGGRVEKEEAAGGSGELRRPLFARGVAASGPGINGTSRRRGCAPAHCALSGSQYETMFAHFGRNEPAGLAVGISEIH